jgi:hypothetical protein
MSPLKHRINGISKEQTGSCLLATASALSDFTRVVKWPQNQLEKQSNGIISRGTLLTVFPNNNRPSFIICKQLIFYQTNTMSAIFPRLVKNAKPLAGQWCATAMRYSSSYGSSVTYSGGQANFGQGGFYGSGGSRVITQEPPQRKEALANAHDVSELVKVMTTIEAYEGELLELGNNVCTRSIELRSLINETLTKPFVKEMLSRLEIRGEPVWGLSTKERHIVKEVRRRCTSGV